jgi:perosamine synthetase
MIKRILRAATRRAKEPVLDYIFDGLMRGSVRGGGRRPFGAQELRLLYRALQSQNLFGPDGQMVPAFERQFAEVYGVPHAIASTSGTAAIHVALGALDLNPGDEVITAPITDLGTIIPILYQGAIPVFADIDGTYNMDPADVEQKISAYTKAIIAVHLFGNPCDMDALTAISRRHRIALIEDCSQAHMARYKGQLVGTMGDIGCFSFQQSKHLTTGDGGMTITSNRAYAERMKLFADKGYARKGWGARAYLFHAPNYRMNELTGAVGLAQLRKVSSVAARRAALGKKMNALLADIPCLTPAPTTPGADNVFWQYPIRVDGVELERVGKDLIDAGVPVSVGYTGKPIYLCSESLTGKKTYGQSQWPFTIREATRTYEYKEGLCPRAEELLTHLLCVLWHESWTDGDVEQVAASLVRCVKNAEAGAISSAPVRPRVAAGVAAARGAAAAGKTRIGIVGCGHMGRVHLDAYRSNPRVEVVGFADAVLENAENCAREAGGNAYPSHTEMIAKERLDGASICTVPTTHRDIAIDLLSAGVHVLCEKPLAVSPAEASEMSRTAQEQKRLLLPAFKFRFHDEIREAKRIIDQGGLGKILTFRLMFGEDDPAKASWYATKRLSGGGVIMDNGPHAGDVIRYLFGAISTVSAEASRSQNIEVEDTATLTCRLASGTVGTIDLSWSVGVPLKAYLEIYGEDGTALLDADGLSYKFKTWSEWRRTPNDASARQAFSRQIDHFVEAIVSGGPLVVSNGEGVKSQEFIDAAYRSLAANGRVSVGSKED